MKEKIHDVGQQLQHKYECTKERGETVSLQRISHNNVLSDHKAVILNTAIFILSRCQVGMA